MKFSPLIFIAFFISAPECIAQTEYKKTEIVQTDEGFQLLRNGAPYYVRGAGGNEHLKELAYIGGNSIRTWSTANGQSVLDSAHKHGLTVLYGFVG